MISWNHYKEELRPYATEGRIELPTVPTECVHNAHMFYIKLNDLEDRTSYIKFMRSHEIGCVFHYVPLHSAPAGLKYGRFDGIDEYTTKESDRLVRLPMYYGLTREDQDTVISFTKQYLESR